MSEKNLGHRFPIRYFWDLYLGHKLLRRLDAVRHGVSIGGSAPEATLCLAVTERESPSDLALLDFISAPPGPTKDIDLVERKLSWAAGSSQMKG